MDALYLNIDRHDDHELTHGYSPALDLVLRRLLHACTWSPLWTCVVDSSIVDSYVLIMSWWTRVVADLLGWLVWVMPWSWTCVVCVVFAGVW